MTELMKRYEAETGESAIMLVCTPNNSPRLNIVKVTDEYIAWLEAQITWRPVSEKPEKKDYYLVKTLNFVFKAYFDGESFRKVVDQKLVELIATHWLPIPPAPEGE